MSSLSYRSVTGKYIHGAQRIERFIDKKIGWVASSIFTRIAACGVPLAAMTNLLYDPIKRLTNKAYAQGTDQCKQLWGDITAMTCGAAWTVLFARWQTTDIDEGLWYCHSEEDVLQYLKAGANPNHQGHQESSCYEQMRDTLLQKACKDAYLEVVKVLIDAGDNVNTTLSKHPCSYRIITCHLEEVIRSYTRYSYYSGCEEKQKRTAIFKALLDAGAAIYENSQVFDLAVKKGFGEIVGILFDMRFRHADWRLALRFNLPHHIPHAWPGGFDVSMLRDAIHEGSWEALHLFWKRFRNEIQGEGASNNLNNTFIGAILETYLKDIVNRFGTYRVWQTDRGQIGSFLREALSKELPSERERHGLKKLMDKVLHLGRRPQDNVFFICAFLFPEDYPEWIKKFPIKEPGGFDVSMLRNAIHDGSWEALHLFWKFFGNEIHMEEVINNLNDTSIGAILETYLNDIVDRFGTDRVGQRDLGQIGPFLRKVLSKELPSERERLRLKELMDKVMGLGRRPQDNVFFICAFLFPEDYPEWIRIFPSKEPGKKEAIAAIESTYQFLVKNYVEKEKADHFSKGSLLDLSDIVRSYIFSETNDQEKRALHFLDNEIRITIQDL